MHRFLSILGFCSYFVTEIQRVTRGHLGRKRARYVRDMWLHHHHQTLQTHLAVSMQRLYRGFRSRKYKHSFYARKRYLAHVNIQNENLRQSMEEQFQAQIEVRMPLHFTPCCCNKWTILAAHSSLACKFDCDPRPCVHPDA